MQRLKRAFNKSGSWQKRDYFDLLVISATHGLSDGFSNLLVPVLALIVLDLNLSTLEVGVLLAVFNIATFLFLYPISMVVDHTGQKKVILIIGLSISAGAYLAMGWAADLFSLSALAFIAGAGNATYHPAGTALTAERFAAQRAIAISFHGLGGNVGASLMPLLQAAIATAAGWRNAIAACVLPAIVLLPLVGIRFSQTKRAKAETEPQSSLENIKSLTKKVLKNRDVVILGAVYFLHALGSKGMVGFLPLLASENFAMDTKVIGLAISVYYTMGVLSKPMMGYLYNRWGARSALLVPLLLTGLFALGIGLAPWQSLFLILVTLVGIATPISPILLTAAADRSDQSVLASSVGYIYTCQGLGFFSPLIGGWLAQQSGLTSSYIFYAIAFGSAAFLSTKLAARSTDKG